MREMIYLPDVVTLRLDQEACNGCGMCIKVCPHNVFDLVDKRAQIVRKDYCMECGACAMNCPKQAISVAAGVGCAAGIISGILRNTEPSCGCSGSGPSCC
ncbi:MAG: mercury methylation ferredoxin HgcB [Bacteroidales bacterium]|jgi:NAD-dependent dihydropyrimidine dehydrogenase PreA subunit|nr:mercury methylation ferredoxin HgcB [Bacteroidales bacterium]